LFLCSQQAALALQEAIRIAQESNDHVCLQHCLSWLYILEQKKADSGVLLEHSVKKSVFFGLPVRLVYLSSMCLEGIVILPLRSMFPVLFAR
uniref:Anaphase-promoting complex subunit 5 n=1 Tax=Anolis carolinensis TaxID=28377 RepID=H9GJP3_ANOCA